MQDIVLSRKTRSAIWVDPELRASNCVRHMVSSGLDGLKFLLLCKVVQLKMTSQDGHKPGNSGNLKNF